MKERFIQFVAASLRSERFTLVDIGCSGGIESVWREFGDRFAAVGFDASVSECRRLAAEEANPNVHYVAGFVDIPPDHPFAVHAGPWNGKTGSFHDETSSKWAMELRAKRLATLEEKLHDNQWQATELADPKRPLYAPKVLAEMGHTGVDFLKIDIDGPDFRVLNSFDGLFDKLDILGMRLEVNMFGGDTANTFDNTSRFVRRQGYELVRLDSRSYSKRALPARFSHTAPAQTVSGRIMQADAYFSLLPLDSRRTALLGAEKLIKLAAIFSAWDQPDGAAEILLKFRDRLASMIDVDGALDILAAQTQPGEEYPLSYRDYMALFAEDSPRFYPSPPKPPEPPWQPSPRPTFVQRLQAAWHSVSDWSYIEKLMGDLRERRRS